jgi:hypothetical protein
MFIYGEWVKKTHSTSLTGRIKWALMEMFHWILEAWRSVWQDVIVKSLKLLGSLKKMDRSEHDFLLSVWQRKLPGGCD